MNSEYITRANKSFRKSGAVGAKALIPQLVAKHLKENPEFVQTILDFGAGKEPVHLNKLRESFAFNAFYAYDFGANQQENYIDPAKYQGFFSIVYASNVLNVQGDVEMLEDALNQIYSLCCKNGLMFLNMPKSPNYHGKNINFVVDFFKDCEVISLDKSKQTLIIRK